APPPTRASALCLHDALPIFEARCRYLASTRYDDTVCIETTLLNVTRTRMSFAYRVFLERPADEAGVGGPAGDVGVSGSADESGFDAAAGEVGVDGPADECGVNAAADKVRAAGPRGDGARAAQPGRLPRLVAEGETMHAFVDERHRPVDVKKRFPDGWAKLAPLAEALRAAGVGGCRLSTEDGAQGTGDKRPSMRASRRTPAVFVCVLRMASHRCFRPGNQSLG